MEHRAQGLAAGGGAQPHQHAHAHGLGHASGGDELIEEALGEVSERGAISASATGASWGTGVP